MTQKNTFTAIITKSSKREYQCFVPHEEREIIAVALREIIRKDHLVVGDQVKIRPIENDDKYEIFELIPRSSEIFRKIVRINKKKVIAANVDLGLIVSAVSKPNYKANLIDRYLTRAKQWQIEPVIIFNKMDQFDNQFDIEFEKKKFESLGIRFFEVSNKSDDWNDQLDKLKDLLQDKTSIFLGQSGVGKSQLINNLTNEEFSLKTNVLAKGVDKGSHTTTWSEYYQYKQIALIDSPGIRSLAMNDIEIEDLDLAFEDIINLSLNCKFKDCKHLEKSNRCYFKELSPETIENQIILSRLNSYIRIREEIEEIPKWKK